MEVDSEQYRKLEKSFHGLTELHLRQFCESTHCDYGSAAGVCHKLVEQLGMAEAQAKLEEYRKNNTDTEDFEDDFEKGACLPIPVQFLDIKPVYPPGQLLQCTLKLDAGFIKSVSRRDWIGLFEAGWKYLNSYITFEWISTRLDDSDIMTINFAARTLPSTDKAEPHVLCYVTRSGDVLGVSTPFFFRCPGLSFTDPDTLLVDEESLLSMNSKTTNTSPTLYSVTSGGTTSGAGSSTVSSSGAGSSGAGSSGVSPASISPLSLDISMITMDNIIEDTDLGQTIRDKEEIIEDQKLSISQLTVKTEQQQVREDEQWEKTKELERNNQMLNIKNEEIRGVKEALEESLQQGLATIEMLGREKEEMRVDHERRSKELEDIVKELTDKIQSDFISSVNDEVIELQRMIDVLVAKNSACEEELAKCKTENAEIENLQKCTSSEVPKLEAFIRAKDGIIKKLTGTNQIAAEIAKSNEGKLYSLTKENEKYRDDYKRLNNDMTDVLKKYKVTQDQINQKDNKIRKLQEDLTQMRLLNVDISRKDGSADVAKLQVRCQQYERKLFDQNEESKAKSLKIQSLEKKHAEEVLRLTAETSKAQFQLRDLQNIQMGQDEEMQAVTVISLHARIAQLEQQLQESNNSLMVSAASSGLEQEVEGLKRELVETQENEMNFRAGIKDLRTQLVSLTLQIDQKNELLGDKGELIDTLRLECQERQERERFAKHRTALCERKLQEEGESYMQIISDLQSQLTGYANAHIQFERNKLVKCPFCPAAYEQQMQAAMTEHIRVKHP